MCSERNRLLIIHPEGNFHNNPNLFGIVELLLERGVRVDYLCEHQSWNVTLPELSGLRVFKAMRGRIPETLAPLAESNFYQLIIGIDQGILDGAEVACRQGIPLGYISYEILFVSESGADKKAPEIEACSNICFAVVQDEIRGRCLHEENRIPLEKMIHIPVAYRGLPQIKKSSFVRDALKIPHDKKIALYMGAVNERGMISSILQSLQHCPEDWVLLLHDRYGKRLNTASIPEAIRKRIYISNLQFDDFRTSDELLCGVDIGLAFYNPLYTSELNGKNIANIGMAGGKISTYLQYGVPVVINDIDPMNRYVAQFNLGSVCHDFSRLWDSICEAHTTSSVTSCQSFFDSHLNLDRLIDPFMEQVLSLMGPAQKTPVPQIRPLSFKEYLAQQQHG